MDPDTTWSTMVKAAGMIAWLLDEQPRGFEGMLISEGDVLSDAVRALNDWLSHGGALPAAWMGGR